MAAVRAGFRTQDARLQKLYDAAEAKAQGNVRDFGGRRVLVEGGGYEKIWLETQPMGGEMYAKRDLDAALNNQVLFMETRRADGRIPGSIQSVGGAVVPQFNKLQGFCFPAPALDMFYLAGRDMEYLRLLRDTLRDFDAYLWRVRDSDGDGCLESWCVYDTGEDNALRYGDAPRWWEGDAPPEGYAVVPVASMDVMGYSFSARDTLADVSRLLGLYCEARAWRAKACEVSDKIRGYLWDAARGACFDRNKHGASMPALIHNTLRLMYWGALDADAAGRFVSEHLLNPQEFWTPMPLPSVAANDPLFRNNPANDWSGQPQGLTYQRAIRALENYGYLKVLTRLGRKILDALGEGNAFTQQFDPFSMRPSVVTVASPGGGPDVPQTDYGPTVLSALEYISRLYGIHISRGRVCFGLLGGMDYEYFQEWQGRGYRIKSDGGKAEAYLDGRLIFRAPCGLRVNTGLDGVILDAVVIEPDERLEPDLGRVEAAT